MSEPILRVRNLKVVFPGKHGVVRAVEGIDLTLHPGECAALVGESGCGKSVTSLALMRLLSSPPALWQADELTFDGRDMLTMSENELLNIRGKDLCMIFQDALTALNPVMTIGRQMDEIFLRHEHMSRRAAWEASIHALELVGVPSPELRYRDYPHQLSGGMRQRILIAMAFSAKPKLIIADEPTTALDVTIQAQVLDILRRLQKECGTALLLITHDLSVVAHMADTVHVMYCGKMVEEAPLREIFHSPAHPYTQGLMDSVPSLSATRKRYYQIPDHVPSPMHKPEGCYFHPRCDRCTEVCRSCMPAFEPLGDTRRVRCFHPLDMQKED